MSIPGCRDKGSVGIDKGTVYTFNAAGEYGNPASGTTTWTYMGPEFDVVAPEIPFEDGTRNGSKVYVVEKSELAPGSGMYMYGACDWLTLDGNVISGENVLVETEYTLKAGSNPDSGLRSGARTAEILILPADIAHGVSSVDDLFEEGSFGAADLKAEYRDYITATVNQDAPSGVFSARDLASAAKNGDAFRTMEYSNPEDQTAMDAIDPDGTIRYLYRMTYTTEWSNVELNYDPSYESCFTKENLPKCVRAFTSEGIGHPMDDPWASVEAIEAVSGGDGEPMTAPAFRISMGSAESAKSCFLVFYDTNQTPYAAICCDVDTDNGGQSGGFEAAFTNPDLTEGATLERITEENMNRIAGKFAEKDGTAESWTSTFAEALGMGQTIYALTYTSAAPKNTELTVSAYSNVMCMPWGIAWLSAEPTGDTGIDITMSRPGAEDPATGMVNFMDASGETACIIYCNPAF